MPDDVLTGSNLEVSSPVYTDSYVRPKDVITAGMLSQSVLNYGDRHVRRSGDDYLKVFANLLPTGMAWPREPSSVLMTVMKGLAQIFGTVDRRAADLLEIETDPRTTRELLTDWERNWGLPDSCFLGVGTTLAERHRLLLLKMTIQGGQSRTFFIWVALQLGYTDVNISEYAPFMAGVSNVGDTRSAITDENQLTGPFGVFV